MRKKNSILAWNPTGIQTLANYLSTDSKLIQNFNNPFAEATPFTSILNQQAHAKQAVYSCFGEDIKVLVNAIQSGGEYTVTFNSSGIAAEIYFYSLTTLE